MRAWYMPSWNGDLRLESDSKNEDRTVLSIVKPTAHELEVLAKIREAAVREQWCDKNMKWHTRFGKRTVILDAKLTVIGPVVAKIMRPGEAVLTAIKFSDGRVVTCTGAESNIAEVVKAAEKEPEKKVDEKSKDSDEKSKEQEKKVDEKSKDSDEKLKETAKPTVAATVKRPTPCCPQCLPGAVGPASEVLLSFLDEEQHAQWAKERRIVVEGGLSGYRYLLAHRHTESAQRVGKICLDVDSGTPMHFHDWSVPPEEEILAAKLILEHREPWLRNEATCFGSSDKFKNPFGGGGDGTESAAIAVQFGRMLGEALGFLKPLSRGAIRMPGGGPLGLIDVPPPSTE